MTIVIILTLIDSNVFYWMHIIFLTYPSLINYFLILIQAKNFQAKVRESKALSIDISQSSQQVLNFECVPSFWDCITYLINKDILGKDMILLHEESMTKKRSQDSYLKTNQNFDEYKIHMIQYEFIMNFFINVLNVWHYLLLLAIKGMNLNLFSHVAIGKTLIQSLGKTYTDLTKYF